MAFYEPQSKSKLFFRKRDIISQLNHFSHSRHISVYPFRIIVLFYLSKINIYFSPDQFDLFFSLACFLFPIYVAVIIADVPRALWKFIWIKPAFSRYKFTIHSRFHFMFWSLETQGNNDKKKKKIEANAHLLRIF